jgi:hypothetical protein
MKKPMSSALTIAVGGILLSSISAFSQTLLGTTTYGGATYELWGDTGIAWSAAEANAVGLGGTLAVLTTSAQTTSVYNNLIPSSPFAAGGFYNEVWLGASPAVPDSNGATTDPNNWAWVNGAPWTSFDAGNFEPGEPNGDNFSNLGMNLDGTAQWNDEGDASIVGGYIVEISSVPDGGLTMAMLGAAISGLAVLRRKL